MPPSPADCTITTTCHHCDRPVKITEFHHHSTVCTAEVDEGLVSIETGEVSAQSDVYLVKDMGERYGGIFLFEQKLISSDNEI